MLSNPAVGYGTQDFLETQLEATSAASPGQTPLQDLYYEWDES